MAEKLYEGMFLVESAKFAADSTTITNEILGVLEKVDAEIVAHRPWHDGRLAYVINGQRKGVHYLVMFKMDSLKSAELDRATRLNDTIMRSLIINQSQVLFDANVAALTGEQTEPAAEATPEKKSETKPEKTEAPAKDEVAAES